MSWTFHTLQQVGLKNHYTSPHYHSSLDTPDTDHHLLERSSTLSPYTLNALQCQWASISSTKRKGFGLLWRTYTPTQPSKGDTKWCVVSPCFNNSVILPYPFNIQTPTTHPLTRSWLYISNLIRDPELQLCISTRTKVNPVINDLTLVFYWIFNASAWSISPSRVSLNLKLNKAGFSSVLQKKSGMKDKCSGDYVCIRL